MLTGCATIATGSVEGSERRVSLVTRVMIVVLLCALFTGSTSAGADCSVPLPIAHRGGIEVFTENTAEAIASTARNGIRAVEIDVRFARNGRPLLMHDATVDRTTNGTGKVSALRWTQVLGLRTDDGLRVPSLETALETAQRHDIRLVVLDVKGEPTGTQWSAIRRQLDATGMHSRSTVMSRLQPVIAEARRRGFQTTLLDKYDKNRTAAYLLKYGKRYAVRLKGTTREDVARWRAAGIRTSLGIKDGEHPFLWAEAAKTGAERVMTDRPIAYRLWRGTQCGF